MARNLGRVGTWGVVSVVFSLIRGTGDQGVDDGRGGFKSWEDSYGAVLLPCYVYTGIIFRGPGVERTVLLISDIQIREIGDINQASNIREFYGSGSARSP
jgi:hypothetical protein